MSVDLDIETKQAERRRMTLNMGPQHPSTHGVLRVVLELDGERPVDGLEPRISDEHVEVAEVQQHLRRRYLERESDRAGLPV